MASHVVEYYEQLFSEADRLSVTALGRLEFARTQELVRRHLPGPGASVVDVGGGAGVHAEWLVRDGYDVHLIDIVPAHVEMARRTLPAVSSVVADARDIPLPDDCADVVLCLGPLYHLTELSDRMAALRELIRIARPGAVIFVAGVARYSALLAFAIDGVLSEESLDALRTEVDTGRHSAALGFTDLHMHSPDELLAELLEAGVHETVVYGVEGPLWPAARLLPADADLRQYEVVARELEGDPGATTLSSHLLAVGRA